MNGRPKTPTGPRHLIATRATLWISALIALCSLGSGTACAEGRGGAPPYSASGYVGPAFSLDGSRRGVSLALGLAVHRDLSERVRLGIVAGRDRLLGRTGEDVELLYADACAALLLGKSTVQLYPFFGAGPYRVHQSREGVSIAATHSKIGLVGGLGIRFVRREPYSPLAFGVELRLHHLGTLEELDFQRVRTVERSRSFGEALTHITWRLGGHS